MTKYKQRNSKWFASATPVNAVKSSLDIGAGDNGVVTIEYDFVGTDGNDYTVTVVDGVGVSVDLSAVLVGTDVTVTLGTDGAEALDDAKNTATLVAGVIDALTDLSAVASGTGVTVIANAVSADLAGGLYSTPSGNSCFIIISDVMYICEKPVGRFDESGWKSGSLTTI